MNDYIKREDINKLLNDLSFVTKTVIYNRTTGHTLEDILEHDFSELPSADVRENITAHKVIGGGEHDGATCWFECGNCQTMVDINDKYCSECGARFEV